MVKDHEESPTLISDIEDADDTIIKVIFTMSKNTWEKLGHIALDRETSRASLVREAIKEYIKTLEQPTEQNPKIPDRQLDKLLEECSYEDTRLLELDGEDGFIEAMKAKDFKLRNLTPEQWKKVQEKIQDSINLGTIKFSSLEEFAKKFDDLEPSEEQYRWLSTHTSEEDS